ncbi:hypothetical protein C8R43DRAFT_365931 [Mycena crocata]|nr:hypothetical protein C8R43DRAFT_365931 [Mycena crocata]
MLCALIPCILMLISQQKTAGGLSSAQLQCAVFKDCALRERCSILKPRNIRVICTVPFLLDLHQTRLSLHIELDSPQTNERYRESVYSK